MENAFKHTQTNQHVRDDFVRMAPGGLLQDLPGSPRDSINDIVLKFDASFCVFLIVAMLATLESTRGCV